MNTLDIIVIALIVLGSIYAIVDLTGIKDVSEGPAPKVPTPKVPKKVEVKPEKSFKERLTLGLSKTRTEVWGKVFNLLSKDQLSDEEREELEEVLFTSDLSPKIVDEIMDVVRHKKEGEDSKTVIKNYLLNKMLPIQEKLKDDLFKYDGSDKLKVIMIVGVNGAGKTTTIGKLATKLKSEGAKVVVGACDTFRAAAVEQLEVWCKRADVEIVKAQEGADPSGVAYDAVKTAIESKANYCLIDTAGRLHTKSNLMEELSKTKRVMSKLDPDAPHDTILVLDAITGQNALRQANEFNKALELTGLIFTKLDGSAKAGSAVSIIDDLKVPISYIGVGEDVEDLNIFNVDQYLDALLG